MTNSDISVIAKGMAITLFEKTDGEWTLCCRDQHGKWHAYDPLPPTPDFRKVLREIQADPTGIFWG